MYYRQHQTNPTLWEQLTPKESKGLDFAFSKLNDLESRYLNDLGRRSKPNLKDFQNSVVCITGTLESMTRQKMTKLLEEVFLVEVKDNISQNTDFLICGKDVDPTMHKINKAHQYGIPRIFENRLYELFYEKRSLESVLN